MTTRPIFNNLYQAEEQSVLQDIIVEMIQMYGVDCQYIKRENVSIDPILREETMSHFSESWTIEAYIPDTGINPGKQNFMSKFGFRFDETSEAIIAISRWKELNTGLIRPREGDLLYIGNPLDQHGSFMNDVMQIKQCWLDSQSESPMGAHQTFRLTLANFTKSYETFNTNYDEINNVMNTNEVDEMATSINAAAKQQAQTLVVDRKNPFGDFF